MKETGSRLKEARNQQGLSLEEISIATKIKLSTLESIEEGDVDRLPPKAFVRGFVQSYANYLNLDVNSVMDSFQKEIGSTSAAQDLVKLKSEDNESAVSFANSSGQPYTKFLMIAGTLVLIAGVILVVQIIDKYTRESEVTDVSNVAPIEQTTDIEPAKSAAKSEKSKTETKPKTKDTEKQEEQIAVKPKPEKIKETLPPEEKKPEVQAVVESKPKPEPKPETQAELAAEPEKPKPEASPEPEPKTVQEPKESEVQAQAPIEPEQQKPEPKKPEPRPVQNTLQPQEVILEALDRVQIRFKSDNSDWQNLNLSPEQIYTIKANSKIRVEASDGGVLNVIHNGRDRGVPGNLGEKIQLSYP